MDSGSIPIITSQGSELTYNAISILRVPIVRDSVSSVPMLCTQGRFYVWCLIHLQCMSLFAHLLDITVLSLQYSRFHSFNGKPTLSWMTRKVLISW